MNELLAPVLEHLGDATPGGLDGVYLYVSAVMGKPQPDSDIDLLILARRSLP